MLMIIYSIFTYTSRYPHQQTSCAGFPRLKSLQAVSAGAGLGRQPQGDGQAEVALHLQQDGYTLHDSAAAVQHQSSL